MKCHMALIDASPNTADCCLGELCGCGARYCGVKCLVAGSEEHKAVCEEIQMALQALARNQFRATEESNEAALEWGGHVQIELFRADMLVAASDVVDSLLHAAETLRITEAFELAQKFAQRALALAEKGSQSEAGALTSLGILAKTLSKYDAAVAHYEAALKITKNLRGDNHADLARVYFSLSAVFERVGRLDEALAMCSSALEIFNKAPEPDDNIAICHSNMGNILRQQGKRNEAMKHYSAGLAITLKTQGETATAAGFLLNMGVVLMNQNKLDKATEMYVSALRIFEKAKMDTRVALCHQNLGNLLLKQLKLDAALEHSRKAFEIYQSKGLHEHADSGETRNLIGNILMRSEKVAEAVDAFANALRIFKNVYGEMSLKVADVYFNMALCFQELRNYREAVTYFEATVHISTVLGDDERRVAQAKAFLAQAETQLKAERSSEAKLESVSKQKPPASKNTKTKAELEALSVKELKEILAAHSISAAGCVEKGDIVQRVLEHCS
jgi:tetratricopeptide (TPR) repeat protein